MYPRIGSIGARPAQEVPKTFAFFWSESWRFMFILWIVNVKKSISLCATFKSPVKMTNLPVSSKLFKYLKKS